MKIFYFEATAEELKANLTLTQKLSQVFSNMAVNLAAKSSNGSEGDDCED